MLTFLIILSTSVAGALQSSWWAALAGACLLSLALVAEYRMAAARSPLGHDLTMEHVQALSAFISGSAAAAVAFLLGRAATWFWLG